MRVSRSCGSDDRRRQVFPALDASPSPRGWWPLLPLLFLFNVLFPIFPGAGLPLTDLSGPAAISRWLAAATALASDQVGSGPRAPAIEAVEIAGNTRTSESVALSAIGLGPGDPATVETIQAAADRLRASQLFADVETRARPGSAPGNVVVVFMVRERGPQLRLGLGYEDLAGWYLIPAQINLDNLTGHGEDFRASARIGYRVGGLHVSYGRPFRAGSPLRWALDLRAEGAERIYFFDRTEIRHHVGRGAAELRIERTFGETFTLDGWIGAEGVEADSTAEVYRDRAVSDRHEGDEIDFDQLPPEIQRDLGQRDRVRIGASLSFDGRRRSGLEARGLRGRVGIEEIADRKSFLVSSVDMRAYQPIGTGVQLATRVRASAVSSAAPFYDRLYLGGLYTVRGYPSQSLSPPHGHAATATASLELRTAWLGPAGDPRLVALAFLDGGTGWETLPGGRAETAAGAGFGFHLRVPWIGRVGIDVGHPLSRKPVDESFHINAGIGWTF